MEKPNKRLKKADEKSDRHQSHFDRLLQQEIVPRTLKILSQFIGKKTLKQKQQITDSVVRVIKVKKSRFYISHHTYRHTHIQTYTQSLDDPTSPYPPPVPVLHQF